LTINRILAVPFIFQALSIIAPFIYLKLAYEQGVHQALTSEFIQSIVGFGIVAIDFSASTFLAKKQKRLISKGALSTIVAGRFFFATFIFFVGIACLHLSNSNLTSLTAISFFMILLAVVIEPSWIFIGKGALWVPPCLAFFRFSLASILILFQFEAVLSLGFGYLIGSVIFILPICRQLNITLPLKFRLYRRILRSYFLPTIAEGVTSIFSRLDVMFAIMVLQPSHAFIYTATRKVIVGFQSVAQSGSKAIFLYRHDDSYDKIKSNYRLLCYTLFLTSIPITLFFLMFAFGIIFSLDLLLTIMSLSMLLLVSYYKTVLQLGGLYIERKFGMDLTATILSCLFFVLCSAIQGYLELDSSFLFAISRVLADLIYIVVAFYLLRLVCQK